MTRVMKPRPSATVDRDPVVAYAAMLGQAWDDHELTEGEDTYEADRAADEAYARVEAYEAMIRVTPATTLAGAAAQLVLATTILRNEFDPEVLGAKVEPFELRRFDAMVLALENAQRTIAKAGAVDLRALGMGSYMYPDVLTGAERVNSE
jgi:hypothetical protein